MTSVRVAAVQAPAVAFDTAASVAAAERWIAQAGRSGATLVVLPEGFLGGYPRGADFGATVGARTAQGRDLLARYLAAAVRVPGPETDRLCPAAARHPVRFRRRGPLCAPGRIPAGRRPYRAATRGLPCQPGGRNGFPLHRRHRHPCAADGRPRPRTRLGPEYPVTTLLFLFDLAGGVDPAEYEAWAAAVDLPRLRALPSVRSYRILRSDPAPEPGPQEIAAATAVPLRYIEIIDVTSAERFSHDMAQPGIAEVASTFRRYAATPTVFTCAELAHTAPSSLPAAPLPGGDRPIPSHQEQASMTENQTLPAPPNQVTATPAASPEEANAHFRGKLAFEADPADIAKAIAADTVNFTLVDCRPTGNYTKTHLPGAVSLPWAHITAETAAGLPDGLLITYCWGPSCNAATKGAERLSRYGRQVKEMIGGIEYWIREGHPTEGRRPVVRGEEKPLDWGLVV